jgi:hypothetical protein
MTLLRQTLSVSLCGDNTDSAGAGLADKLCLKPKIDGQNPPLQGYYSAF